jgi:hypothetical protein
MPDITAAYNWVIRQCNAPNVGYSQAYRQGQIVNGIKYYDCSSLMSEGLTVGNFFHTNPWFTTASEPDYLIGAGFTQHPASVEWNAGDIVWRRGHTEMVYQNRITMGAHTDTYPLDQQVSINTYASDPASYTYVYKYGNGALPANSYNVWMGWVPNESGFPYGSTQSLAVMGDRGRAYGAYQFDYRYGLVPFLEYCVNNYPQFNGFTPFISLGAGNTQLVNNNILHSLFANYAINYTADFLAAQNAVAIEQYLQPAIDYITNNYNYDIKDKGAVVLGSLFSMAIRSGAITAARKYANCANMSPVDIINYTYDTYGDGDAGRWLPGTPISQRDKALNALVTGDDIFDLNAGGGEQPQPPQKQESKLLFMYLKNERRNKGYGYKNHRRIIGYR